MLPVSTLSKRKTVLSLAAFPFAMTCLLAVRSDAATLTYTGTGVNTASPNNALAAEVDFTYSGSGNLVVDLKNTAAHGADVPSDVFTNVYFSLPASRTLAPLSAALGSGATLLHSPASPNLGQQWEYLAGLSGPGGTNAGIGSSGLGIFGSGNFAANGVPTDGMNYGLVSGIDSGANSPVKSGIFAQSSMEFTLSVSANFQLSDITNVRFQYGTSSSEPLVTAGPGSLTSDSPEPGKMSLLVCLVGTVGLLRRRRRTAARS